MPVLLRRLLLWTVICVVSAAPSFVWAGEFSRPAMVIGVCLFIAGYTAFTSTETFDRFHRKPFVRRTLYIGYGLRLCLSIAFPLALAADLYPGLVSVEVGAALFGRSHGFAATLFITCVQGALLNGIIAAFMFIVYWVQRWLLPVPTPREPRGFDVIPLATATTSPDPAIGTPSVR